MHRMLSRCSIVLLRFVYFAPLWAGCESKKWHSLRDLSIWVAYVDEAEVISISSLVRKCVGCRARLREILTTGFQVMRPIG